MRGNTKVMSEMLTEMVPGQEDPSDHELLQVCLSEFLSLCTAFAVITLRIYCGLSDYIRL